MRLEQFAPDDGFLNLEEMTAFWKAEHDPLPPIWSGVIIYWKPLVVTMRFKLPPGG